MKDLESFIASIKQFITGTANNLKTILDKKFKGSGLIEVTTETIRATGDIEVKLKDIPTNTFLGRVASGTGVVKALSVTEMQNALGVLQDFDDVLSRGGSFTSSRTIDAGPFQFYTKAKSSDNDISIDVKMNTSHGALNSTYVIESKSSLSEVGSSIDIRPDWLMLSSWGKDPEHGSVRIRTNRSTGHSVFSANLKTYQLTQSRTFLFPNASGTIALEGVVSEPPNITDPEFGWSLADGSIIYPTNTTQQINFPTEDLEDYSGSRKVIISNGSVTFNQPVYNLAGVASTLNLQKGEVADIVYINDKWTNISPIPYTGTAPISINANHAVSLNSSGVTATHLASNAVTTVKIANKAVTLAKMADLAANSLIGRGSGTGVPQRLSLGNKLSISGTEINAEDTTYNVFTRIVDGLVPRPTTTTTTRYLREDGTWVVPPNATYTTHSLSQLRAGTNTTNRLTNPSFIHTFVKEEVLPQSVITSSAYNIDDTDNGKTIIITGNVGVEVFSTPTYSEFYLVNHTGGSRPIYLDRGLTFNVYGANTTGTCHVKAWGTAIIIRLNSSTYLLKGDVGTGAN